MARSRVSGLGLLIAVGLGAPLGCSSDSSSSAGDGGSDGASEASASSGGNRGSGGAATGGKASTGGASDASTGGAASEAGAGGASADAGSDATPDAAVSPDGGSDASVSADAEVPDAAAMPEADVLDATASLDAAAGDASSVLTCGTAPYVRLWVGGMVLLDHPTSPISLTADACPGKPLTLTPKTPPTAMGKTGQDAQFFDVPDKTPMHLRATQSGSFPFLSQEFRPASDSLPYQFFGYIAQTTMMIATDSHYDQLDPSWNASTRAVLMLQVTKLEGATGSCATTTGITVSVDNHPEATGTNGTTPIVVTNANGGTPIYLTTTGTAASAPELVTLTVTKTGCTVKTTGYDASPGIATMMTGKYPVEAGAITSGLVAIGN